MATSSANIALTLLSLALMSAQLDAPSALTAQTQTAPPSPNQLPAASRSVEKPLRFEVASIRPHSSSGDESSDRQMLPGGRFVATATTVRTLIRIALGTEDSRIFGAPSWTGSEAFDINAVVSNQSEVKNSQQFQELILSLLEDRFQFKFHREPRKAPVYWLEVDKPGRLGPALTQSAPAVEPSMSNNANESTLTMKATKVSMRDFAAALQRQVGRPVEDHTDLQGTFDIRIEWAREETLNSNAPHLFTVLKEQLGLKLRPATGEVETIVIDEISRPSPN